MRTRAGRPDDQGSLAGLDDIALAAERERKRFGRRRHAHRHGSAVRHAHLARRQLARLVPLRALHARQGPLRHQVAFDVYTLRLGERAGEHHDFADVIAAGPRSVLVVQFAFPKENRLEVLDVLLLVALEQLEALLL